MFVVQTIVCDCFDLLKHRRMLKNNEQQETTYLSDIWNFPVNFKH